MIEIFSPSNTEFSKNGDMVLEPLICDINCDLESIWSLELEHPIDKLGRWKHITENSVLRVPYYDSYQLYRIRTVEISDSGVKASARPIWTDAQYELFLLDVRPTNKNGQEALGEILRGQTKYLGYSDIATRNTAYYTFRNALEAILNDDNAFIKRWGGEIFYDNYKIYINKRIGGDYGVELLYGKNIPVNGLKEKIDIDGVVTRIVPKAFNGIRLPGNAPWIDSPIATSYPTIRVQDVSYDYVRLAADVQDGETDGLIVCNTLTDVYDALREEARKDFEKGIDKPKITIDCQMVLLQDTKEYSNYEKLEKVGLGDTIYCNHSKLGIVSTARVKNLVWDCIRKKVKNVTIGDGQVNFVSRITSSIKATEKALTKNGSVLAGQIEGIIDLGIAQLKHQQDVAKRQEVRAIIFEDLDPNSSTFGAMCQGTQGIQISRQRTADNRDWVWTTAITSEGLMANTLIAQDQLYVAKHFFADENGVHITEDEYDYVDGNNIFIDYNSVDIREGTKVLASFGLNSVIGPTDGKHINLNTGGIQLLDANKQLANFGVNTVIGDSVNNISLNTSGVTLTKNSLVTAKFSESITLGRTGESRVIISTNSTNFYDIEGTNVGTIKQNAKGAVPADNINVTGYGRFSKSGSTWTPTTITKSIQLPNTPVSYKGSFINVVIDDNQGYKYGSVSIESADTKYTGTYKQRSKEPSGWVDVATVTIEATYVSATNTINIVLKNPSSSSLSIISIPDGYISYYMEINSSIYRFGKSLNNTGLYSFAVGIYNANDQDALFLVGNGSASQRRNVFKINRDDTIYIGGQILAYDQNMVVDSLSVLNNANINSLNIDNGLIYKNTTFIPGNDTTDSIQIWGNSSVKVGVAVRNNVDGNRFDLRLRNDGLQLYDYNNEQAVYTIPPAAFISGQTVSLNNGPYIGHITNSSKRIEFFIPTPRQANGRTVTMNKLPVIIRSAGKYVDDSYNVTTVGESSEYTWTVVGRSNGLYLTLSKTTAFTDVTNNSLVSVVFRSNPAFTFS